MHRMRIKVFLALFILVLISPTSLFAATEQRIALVIGNSAYSSGPLKNPVNDATAMAAMLMELDFTVTLKKNVKQQEMDESIREFGRQLKRTRGVGLFYYAGHGIQVGGVNYLLPVNARIDKESDVRFQSVNSDIVLAEMENAENGLNIVILDACRDNPYGKSFRNASRGLAIVTSAPSGTFISYSTGPGQVAKDGEGKNSPYTKALLENMTKPGLTLNKVFMNVRSKVKKETGQIPWELSSLEGDFYFIPGSPEKSVAMVPSGRATVKREESSVSTTETTDNLDDENQKLEAEQRRLEEKKAALAKKKALEEKQRKIAEEKERQAAEQEAAQRRIEEEKATLANKKASEEKQRKIAEEKERQAAEREAARQTELRRIEEEKAILAKNKTLEEKQRKIAEEKERQAVQQEAARQAELRRIEEEKATLAKKKALEEKQRKIAEEKERQLAEREALVRKNQEMEWKKVRDAELEQLALERRKLEAERQQMQIAMAKLPSQQTTVEETGRDGRFIAYNDGTVLDTRTKLMWAAKDNGRNIGWMSASSYCNNYRGGGYSDWRMPTQNELAGLYDKSKGYKPVCAASGDNDKVHLTNLITMSCWGGWANETRISEAAYFYFSNGGRSWPHSFNSYEYRVLPVRSVK